MNKITTTNEIKIMNEIAKTNVINIDFYRNKRILVAGASGFIGTNLIKKLLNIDRMYDLNMEIVGSLHKREPCIKNNKVKYMDTDLENIDWCNTITSNIDYVFMCAANTSGAGVIKSNPLIHITPNILMNTQMLEASYNNNVEKFVFISSSAIYPDLHDTAVKEEDAFIQDPYKDYFGVGWMKRYIEKLCEFYSCHLKPPMDTIIIRPSNIYGPYDKFNPSTSHVMSSLIRKVINRDKPLEVWGTGGDIRDFIYIDDFIDATLLATEKIDTFSPINISYGEGYSVREVLHHILETDKYTEALNNMSNADYIIYNFAKPSTIPVRLIDNSKMISVLKYYPETTIEEGIKKTVEWYRENVYSSK